MVNSGRLSRPCAYPLTGADDPALPMGARPGMVAPDAPLAQGWLSESLHGQMVILALNCPAPQIGITTLQPEVTPLLAQRYLGQAAQALYLIRPDQVVAARWISPQADQIQAANRAVWEGH
jgi:3-(3-hydroxy-phenyl)propionate hydroxylase